MIALVAGDGRRLVVWGIGATHAEATADLGEDAPRVDDCEEYEITEAQAEVVRRGDVSWPVVVPDPSYEDETRDCLGLALHGRSGQGRNSREA
jgi:hypothetical protein